MKFTVELVRTSPALYRCIDEDGVNGYGANMMEAIEDYICAWHELYDDTKAEPEESEPEIDPQTGWTE